MRSVSAVAREQFYKQSSGYALPVLIEINHNVAGYDNPLRLVNNNENLIYNEHTYYAYPFVFQFPSVKENGTVSTGKLQICAVDQQIARIIRTTSVPPTMRVIATFYYDDGVITFEPVAMWDFDVVNISGTTEVISADLIYETRLGFEYPAGIFSPLDFPGLH